MKLKHFHLAICKDCKDSYYLPISIILSCNRNIKSNDMIIISDGVTLMINIMCLTNAGHKYFKRLNISPPTRLTHQGPASLRNSAVFIAFLIIRYNFLIASCGRIVCEITLANLTINVLLSDLTHDDSGFVCLKVSVNHHADVCHVVPMR